MEQFVKDFFLGRVQVLAILKTFTILKTYTINIMFFLNFNKNFVNSNVEKYKDVDLEKYLDTIYLYYNKLVSFC
jgi:hypothetical protein